MHYGKMIEEAGADALELNIYFIATDPERRPSEVENQYLELVSGVRAVGVDSAGGEDRPVLQLVANVAKKLFGYRGRRPGAVQPFPPAGHQPGNASC